MIYALIKNGIVANMIVADEGFLPRIEDNWDDIILTTNEPGGAKIGDMWDGTSFITPPPLEEPPA